MALPVTSASQSYTLVIYAPAPDGSGTETVAPATAKANSTGFRDLARANARLL